MLQYHRHSPERRKVAVQMQQAKEWQQLSDMVPTAQKIKVL